MYSIIYYNLFLTMKTYISTLFIVDILINRKIEIYLFSFYFVTVINNLKFNIHIFKLYSRTCCYMCFISLKN